MPGLDVTVNWKCQEMDSGGVFFTDSNGLEMVRRHADDYNERYNTTTSQRASSNYYPVNSGIFIEDAGEQMIVMNDRSEGGSAYFDNGRIELMINRRGNTSDDLGNEESLNETAWFDGRELGVRVNAKYQLQFTSSRYDAFSSIRQRYLRTQNPLQYFQTSTVPMN